MAPNMERRAAFTATLSGSTDLDGMDKMVKSIQDQISGRLTSEFLNAEGVVGNWKGNPNSAADIDSLITTLCGPLGRINSTLAGFGSITHRPWPLPVPVPGGVGVGVGVGIIPVPLPALGNVDGTYGLVSSLLTAVSSLLSSLLGFRPAGLIQSGGIGGGVGGGGGGIIGSTGGTTNIVPILLGSILGQVGGVAPIGGLGGLLPGL
ncbi:hypothetical protein QBC46DRAFT_411476 [Diplogelasinospora grovesii]|uniref:Uncharacterized protein n=1 Tax=Diplogelasinospora grovesii TaxID=303347 RepID=A0AAN6N0R2_9PEZI|nr:hypothetical protein QBC46DRAFT_411476 [Diplogelasinospora grovesii]